MATLHVFHCRIPSCNYVFGSPGVAGKSAAFISGKYYTEIQEEIDELNKEIKLKHPHIYIEEGQQTIESELLDPLVALRAKFFEEFVAQQAAAVNPENQSGDYEQGKLIPANTQNIQEAAAGGSGTGLAARLIDLQK